MGSLTEDDKTQLRLLANHLSVQQETIVERWRMKCLQDEALLFFNRLSRKEFTEAIRVLLSRFIQHIMGGFQTRNLSERASQLHHWQDGYSLSEWVIAVANFYDVLNEQFQQFLELYPQTQPRVITQVYSQLFQLSQQVNSAYIWYANELQQTRAEQQPQMHQQTLDTHPQLAIQHVDHLLKAAHDLRSTFGILSTAASLLQKPLKTDDRAKYVDMLQRNVNVATHLLNQLLVNFKV
ncbi:hypothetical protein GO755_39610 [Spirosoma sp. HMF4905]|uniref:histidine kinase n=1 Tax=Spirosoma arboris TaxID=2682092 RepID=A0A7K1SRH8_9BACT|nr:hypothetical protein [Spirosoma arboris]MVM36186.1 hypothetical protein [Spirosoma arboris]